MGIFLFDHVKIMLDGMIIKRLIFTLFLFLVIFISGCVDQDEAIEIKYKDEALKMDIEVSDRVLPSQALNMRVYLTNQVKDKIDNIEFRVTDFYGLKLKNQNCGGGAAIDSSECGFVSDKCGCKFPDGIQSLDQQEMSFVFQVPSTKEVARIGRELSPEFTLKYDYKGETTFLIPIVGENEKTTSAELKLIQTEGPIHVEIDRGFSSSSNDWERTGDGFSILVEVKDVVNPNSEQKIDKNNFEMTLVNLQHESSFGECDFDPVKPKDDINLPMEIPIGCSLKASDISVPWAYGSIKMKYEYTYKDIEVKTITVETVID